MGQHTKGPWKADYLGVIMGGKHGLTSIAEAPLVRWSHCQLVAQDKGAQEVADYCGKMHDEAAANARLIASAPELLEALQALLAQHMAGVDLSVRDRHEWCRAAAAIAKAEGS